ncbi:unnamed protein product, partial [Arctogadus glacialis]
MIQTRGLIHTALRSRLAGGSVLVDLSAGISSGLGSGEDLVSVYGRISHSNVQEESLDTNYWPGESGKRVVSQESFLCARVVPTPRWSAHRDVIIVMGRSRS